MIEALVDAACDREEDVRRSISKSLVEIGRKKHVTVLKICHTYLMKHNRVLGVRVQCTVAHPHVRLPVLGPKCHK